MNDTPRTDAEMEKPLGWLKAVGVGFARRLERELNTRTEACKYYARTIYRLAEENRKLKDVQHGGIPAMTMNDLKFTHSWERTELGAVCITTLDMRAVVTIDELATTLSTLQGMIAKLAEQRNEERLKRMLFADRHELLRLVEQIQNFANPARYREMRQVLADLVRCAERLPANYEQG